MKRLMNLLIAALPAVAFADGEYQVVTTQEVDDVTSEITWHFDMVNYEVRGRTLPALKLTQIDGLLIETSPELPTKANIGSAALAVIEYGDEAFFGQYLVETIAIPNNVKKIGNRAFDCCWNLRSVSLGNAVTEIGDEVFYDCVSLESVTFNYGLRSIGKRLFVNTAVNAISLPATVTAISDNPIAQCRYISAIEVAGANGYFAFDTPLLFNAEKSKLIACLPTATEVSVPDMVTTIGVEAFDGCDLLTGIAFLGDAPESAPTDLFAGLSSKLKIYANTNDFANWSAALANEPWKSIAKAGRFINTGSGDAGSVYVDTAGNVWTYSVVDSVATITSVTPAEGTTIFSLTLPSSIGEYVVKGIGPMAFADLRGLTSVSVPSTYEVIGDYAFSNCTSLASVSLASGVRSLGKAPFFGTAVTSLTLPNTVTSLDGNPLAGCAFLTSLSVDAGNAAFTASEGLLYDVAKANLLACVPSSTSVTLPATLTAIAPDAFAGCLRLTAVAALCEVPSADDAVFADTPASLVTSADAWALTSWQAYIGKNWKNRKFENSGVSDSSNPQTYADSQGNSWNFTTKSGVATIVGMETVPSGEIAIPATVTDATSGKAVAVTGISPKLFADCTAITKVTIPASVVTLTGEAFVGCTALASFAVEAGSQAFSARNGALYSKDGKTLVKVPACFRFALTATSSVTTTDREVIRIVNGVVSGAMDYTIIDNGTSAATSQTVYSFTPSVTSAQLLDGVTRIADYAFADCGYLPAGTTAYGTLVTTTDGKVVSTVTGEVVIPVGTDATNMVTSSSKTTKAGLYNGKSAMWETQQTVSTVNTHSVPLPATGTAAYTKMAWFNSIWYDQIPDEPLLTLGSTATKAQVAAALADAADPKLSANVTTAAEYEPFRTWATSVGQKAVLNSSSAWMSYALGSETLLPKVPADSDVHVETTAISGDGTMTLSISIAGVDIGSSATKDNLRKVFNIQGASSLNPSAFSAANVDFDFGTPQGGKVPVSVRPTQSNVSSFFTKAGLK